MAIKKRFPYRAALVACNGGCRTAGSEDGGCKDGCIGCGACIEKCKFGAIYIIEFCVADLYEQKFIACGQFEKVCPHNLIKNHDCANYIVVKCSNKEKGAVARKQCEVSCIGCGICEKTCTAGAIHVEDNCAVIREDICLSCGMCSVKCPRHVIHDLRGVFTAVR